METRFEEGDLEFTIRRCHVGDETSLSLLGKASFLETYADSTDAADLLDFVEAEHSAERYSRNNRGTFSNRVRSRFDRTGCRYQPTDGDQAAIRLTPLPAKGVGASLAE